MKKSILLLAFGALFTSAFAQDAKPGKGKIFMAGTLGYESKKPMVGKDEDEPDATGKVIFAPSLGFFINDGMAIGGRLSVEKGMVKDMEGDLRIGFGAFLRKYWALSDNFYAFGEASLGYSTYTPSYGKDEDTPDGSSTFGLGVAPGIGYYPGKKLGVEFSLAPLFSLKSDMAKDQTASMDLNLGVSTLVSPTFTITYFLK